MFSDRLDFLMQLTNTSNSALARATAFDQSYVSKLRSGKRALPRNQAFFDKAIPVFARNLTSDYQRKAISDVALKGNPLPEDRKQLEELLTAWLCAKDETENDAVYKLLLGASALTRGKPEAAPQARAVDVPALSEQPVPAAAGALPFYGNEGKRNAVELFLSRLCASGKAHTFLLYSDEDMTWLYEDAAFARRWGAYLTKLLSLGGSVKMIHTVSRDVSEMMEAVQKWIPLYLSGRIEPYFCPRLRDGIYHRSLFVAQGCSALVSNSVGASTENMVNLLFDEPAVVGAFEQEFWNYFALCRPLMRVYRGAGQEAQLRAELRRFDEESGNLYLAQSLPSFFTMPKSVLAAMAGKDADTLEKLRAKSAAAFSARIKSGRQVVELLNLPEPSVLQSEGAALPMWPLLGMPRLAYDAGLLAEHLSAVLKCAEKYENYRVVLSDRISGELMVLASDNVGSMLLCPLPAVFSMEEQNISTAMFEYLVRVSQQEGKRGATAALSKYVSALRAFS